MSHEAIHHLLVLIFERGPPNPKITQHSLPGLFHLSHELRLNTMLFILFHIVQMMAEETTFEWISMAVCENVLYLL
jgi:hypothetical protein